MAKSALRVLDILEFIAEQRQGATHSAIAKALGIPKPSVTVLLRDLVSRGYVVYDVNTSRYGVGIQILSLSQAYLRNLNLVRVAQPIVLEAFEAIGAFCAFSIPRGAEYVILCAESLPLPLSHSLQIGERGPLFCSAAGKSMLAYLPEEQREAILAQTDLRKLTPATVTDLEAIRSELRDVRARGISCAREEQIAGISSIAVPVFDGTGNVIGALSSAAPTTRYTPEFERLVATTLSAGAEKLSTVLGWNKARFAGQPAAVAGGSR